MSLDHAKGMLDKMKRDKDLVEKVKAASDDEKKQIAKDMGYEFTLEEMNEAIKLDSELSDSDLDSVAGGASATWVGVGVGGVAAAAACGW